MIILKKKMTKTFKIHSIFQQILPGNGEWLRNEKKVIVDCIGQQLEEHLQYIDENLSSSLIEITFEACYWDATRKWKNIFTKVEKVNWSPISVSSVEYVNIRKLFSNMRVLQIYASASVDTSFIEYTNQ